MAKWNKVYKKRVVVLLIMLVLAAIAIAMPVLTSLGILAEYVNVGVDILSVPDLFAGGFDFSIITANWAVWALCVYCLVVVIIILKLLLALVSKGKKGFAILSLIALVLAIVFVAAGYNFDFAAIGEAAQDPMALLGSLDYSIYAMAGAPLLTLILGAFAYKKED
ncbi:MAG: hypothetical protein ACOYIQ_03320 [Christensenellales bacterium]|jgi:peptidoglycan/LPS O-acetylase OafA/YrhL